MGWAPPWCGVLAGILGVFYLVFVVVEEGVYSFFYIVKVSLYTEGVVFEYKLFQVEFQLGKELFVKGLVKLFYIDGWGGLLGWRYIGAHGEVVVVLFY